MNTSMLLIDSVLDDVKKIEKCRQLRYCDLKFIGYACSKRFIPIEKTGYQIREVLDCDTLRPVNFCFLFSTKLLQGVILKKDFRHYQLVACQKPSEGSKPSSKGPSGEQPAQPAAPRTSATKNEDEATAAPGINDPWHDGTAAQQAIVQKILDRLHRVEDQIASSTFIVGG